MVLKFPYDSTDSETKLLYRVTKQWLYREMNVIQFSNKFSPFFYK